MHPWLAWAKPYKSQIRPKQGENIVVNSHELYYIVSMYKYYQLALLLILIEKFNQSQTFSPDWLELGLIRAEEGLNWEKTCFSKAESGIT